MGKKKKSVNIINVERTPIDSPLPIYEVDINTNIIVTTPQKVSYYRNSIYKDEKVIKLYYFELLENLLIPMNITFMLNEDYNMPYNIRGNVYKVYKKLEMKKYINSNSLDTQLESIIKNFQVNENLYDIIPKSGVLKKYKKMELYSPREIEIYFK